jgi:hypothetical protein
MKRFANTSEQKAIDEANELLKRVGLVITETQTTENTSGKGGAVIPTKGF